MGKAGALDGIQGKKLYNIMSAACGAAFMLYGWDAGEYAVDAFPCLADHGPGVLGGIQSTPQFLDAIGNPKGAFVSWKPHSSERIGRDLSHGLTILTDHSHHCIDLQPRCWHYGALCELFRYGNWQEGYHPPRMPSHLYRGPSSSVNLFRCPNNLWTNRHRVWHRLHC